MRSRRAVQDRAPASGIVEVRPGDAQVGGAHVQAQHPRAVGVRRGDLRAQAPAHRASHDPGVRGLVGRLYGWYIDGQGRNSTIYPWTTIDLRRRCKDFELGDYDTVEVPGHVERPGTSAKYCV